MRNVYELYNLIGKNVKEFRNQNGDSQEKFAESIEVSRGFISRIESQEIDSGISLDTLFNIAQEYNVDIRKFFDGYERLMKNDDEQS